MGPGGRHAAMGTWNRLTGLDDGTYLEAIAVDPDAPSPPSARWFGLDDLEPHAAPALRTWVVRVDDLDAALRAFPRSGRAVDLARGDLRWRMGVPHDGRAAWEGSWPALIEWQGTPPSFPATGLSLERLTLSHPQADGLRDALADLLDDPRVAVVGGPVGLETTIATPDGPRVLR